MKYDFFLSLIIPVFNEEHRFLVPFQRAQRFVSETFSRVEIIFVDDGSTDGTYDRLLELQRDFQDLRIVRISANCGKGCAVRKGFQEAQGDFILFSDADFSTPIEEIEKLLRALQSGFDIAIGSRSLPESNVEIHQAWWREVLGKTGNFLIRTMLPLSIHDTQCGFKLFQKEAVHALLPKMTVNGFAFDVEILTIAMMKGLRVQEVPVTWRNDEDTKVRPVHSIQVLQDVLKIRYRVAMGEYG